MAYLIKALLTDADQEYYFNTTNDRNMEARNIVLCNLTDSPADAYVAFTKSGDDFAVGAVAYKMVVPANDVVVLQERMLISGDVIRAYASAADTIALSIDIIGVEQGRYTPPDT